MKNETFAAMTPDERAIWKSLQSEVGRIRRGIDHARKIKEKHQQARGDLDQLITRSSEMLRQAETARDVYETNMEARHKDGG